MANVLDYVEIPPCATPLRVRGSRLSATLPLKKIATSMPKSEPSEPRASLSSSPTVSPSPKLSNNISSAILAAGLHIPSPSAANPRKTTGLLSSKEPLSLPLTTTNFRRFAGKSGPIFWIEDRLEEIVMWRKGNMYTGAWMSAYAFICRFPRLILLLPHVILLTILLSAYSARLPASGQQLLENPAPVLSPYMPEGSGDWYANIQGIQNLMGLLSDLYDLILVFVPHLTYSTPYTYTVLSVTVVSFVLLLPVVAVVPLQLAFLVAGLFPLVLTHPWTVQVLLPMLFGTNYSQLRRSLKMRITRFVDDDRLEDRHWQNNMKEVELWENERYASASGWNKTNLRSEERKGWTRARDGWSDTRPDGTAEISNLTFSLMPGWAFVETESWRKDIAASWTDVDCDEDGWVYTDDAWQNACSHPPEEWLPKGLTRRRRWVRRIYRNDSLDDLKAQ